MNRIELTAAVAKMILDASREQRSYNSTAEAVLRLVEDQSKENQFQPVPPLHVPERAVLHNMNSFINRILDECFPGSAVEPVSLSLSHAYSHMTTLIDRLRTRLTPAPAVPMQPVRYPDVYYVINTKGAPMQYDDLSQAHKFAQNCAMEAGYATVTKKIAQYERNVRQVYP